MSFIIDNARMIAARLISVVHDVSLIFPRSRYLVAHSIAYALRAAGGSKSEIIFRVLLINPRTFLIIINMGELLDFARGAYHILVKFDIISMWVAPVHICLTVIVYPHRRIDVIPMLLLPHQRLANGVVERSIGRIGHEHSNAVAVNRAIHIKFPVPFDDLLCPCAVVAIVPLEVL